MEKKEKQKLQFTNARDAGYRMQKGGTSLVVQWLRFLVPSSEGTSSIPGWETKILHAVWPKKKKEKEKKDRGYKRKMTRCWQNSELVILKLPCSYSIM